MACTLPRGVRERGPEPYDVAKLLKVVPLRQAVSLLAESPSGSVVFAGSPSFSIQVGCSCVQEEYCIVYSFPP